MMNDDVRALRLNNESALAMAERTIRRLFILILTIVVMWGLTVGGFIWYLQQYDVADYDIAQDGHGLNFVGGDWNEVQLSGSESEDSQANP